ncbi:Lipid A core -O-antigen ligase [Hartmannibacter diazotrophicus]|uniref:Lipid A core -O-antigen ligase n=1 Tax=Hartmannibacter diazotrophicus TaxID=1482074 RepID=A0A2C9D3N3_9HYPH|nr:O-antigen ligase family protein [Hartmannibacter diazotrophicus]SON54768.1 Lipid A core -O-antigen ligase [Hartmannibacter diazotrophicus]
MTGAHVARRQIRLPIRPYVIPVTLLFCAEVMSGETVFVLAVAYVAVTSVLRHRFVTPPPLFFPLAMIAGVGFFVTIYDSAFSRDAVKGFYYMIRPVVFLYVGFYLSRTQMRYRTLVNAALIVAGVLSLYYAAGYVLNPEVADAGRYALREALGTGYMVVPIALFLVLSHYKIERDIVLIGALSAVYVGAILLSDSRSAIIVFMTLMIAKYFPKPLFSLGAVLLAVLLYFITTPYIDSFFTTTSLTTMLDKLPSGVAELVPVERYFDKDVNDGWRGYEVYRAFTFVWEHPVLYRIFGTGWHSQVPILWKILLGDELLDAIPVFHSGFSTLLVRAGYFGIFMFVVQIALLGSFFSSTKVENDHAREIQTLGLGIAGSLVVLTPLIGGIYNPGSTSQVFLLFLGYCVGRHQLDIREVPRRKKTYRLFKTGPRRRMPRAGFAGRRVEY